MYRLFGFAILTVLFFNCNRKMAPMAEEARLRGKADKLAHEYIITDGHVDLPYRLRIQNFRLEREYIGIPVETNDGDFDYVRAKKGGLDAPFMSIFIPASYQDGRAKLLADSLINMVRSIAEAHPDKFAMAVSPAEVEANFKKGLISLPMGMENGSPIEHDLSNVKYFYDRGIRYITLTHAKANHICDSSYDSVRLWNGLSEFGENVVKEMNRVGIMIDISHVSDSAFYDVLKITQVPVIASHSSCRHYTPGMERNMSDAMIMDLAKKGGVIQINFGSYFLDPRFKNENVDSTAFTTASQIADHIDHVVKLVGVDYVGFGSDFDGVERLPRDVKDVSEIPNVIYELLKRGYSPQEIEKICSKNIFRVWQMVEDYADRQSKI